MPKALNTPAEGATVRVIAQQRVSQGKPSRLGFLQTDESFKGWKVGQHLDFYDDLCKYEGVEEVIRKLLAGAYLNSKQRGPLTTAIGAITRELRKSLKQDPYATKSGNGAMNASVKGDAKTSLQVVEVEGKIESVMYVLTRTH